MIVVDASCLYEVAVDSPRAEPIRAALHHDEDWAAPHIIDVEVFSLIRRDALRGVFDATIAELAVNELRAWPGERFAHRALIGRGWELRDSVRGWDAMYVALAEVLGATLLTMDRRLARAHGPQCEIVVPDI